ncbi:MAG TPA: alkaline phosphatase family protein [Stellaceae bacterium]|jgi:Type I phosphodiesterase / nucleotide pyrophosphatase|nr:alkaline phosphatase family protein [Stellaceae bacterium]
MLSKLLSTTAIATALVAAMPASISFADDGHRGVQHVLLLSIDGFHAVDLEICVAKGTCPNLAKLTEHGTTYTNASTTKPSDSFPGLLAQVTGGTSKSTGVFYDDSYDRTLFVPGSNCKTGPGTETNLAENIDKDQHSIDGGVNASLTGLNSGVAIDPNKLPGQSVSGHCSPLWPHYFIRTNSIFGVIHKHHLRTAWSDKHAAYDIINGNDPDTQPANAPGTNVDDFFAPEINSDLTTANINLAHTLLGPHFSTAPDPTSRGGDFTSAIDAVEFYDGLKVRATLNQINGFDHTGNTRLGPPAIFGMNFQSVSVGQKLKSAGYTDPMATPTADLANAIGFVDTSIGQMVKALQDRDLLENTLVIVSAKHGQSPIDRTKRVMLDDGTVIAGPIGSNFAFDIGDDGVLIWLKNNSGGKTAAAVTALNTFNGDTGIVEWLSGPLLTLNYQDPAHDSRTPDIIGVARVGVIYTSGSKIAEHGGFNEDDTHVALLVSHPDFAEQTVNATVATTQIAPTILNVLGIDPDELDGVRIEGTPVLPGLE